MLAQVEAAGRIVDTLTQSDLDALVLLIALSVIALMGFLAWGVIKIGGAMSKATNDNSNALGRISESNATTASTLLAMRDLLERSQDLQQATTTQLQDIRTMTQAGRDAAVSGQAAAMRGQSEIATVHDEMRAGFERATGDIRKVSVVLETQFPDVIARLDKLSDVLEDAQEEHRARAEAITKQYEEANRKRQANDAAYRDKLDAVLASVGALDTFLKDALKKPKNEDDKPMEVTPS